MSGLDNVMWHALDGPQRRFAQATALVHTLMADIRAGGEVPILHVLDTNVGAIGLYESLGFSARRRIEGLVLEAPAELR